MSHFERLRAERDARMAAINQLRALDEEIGDADMSEEQRAQMDRIHADIDRRDRNIDDIIREGEIDTRSEKIERLIADQHDEGQRSDDDGLTPIEREARALFQHPDSPDARQAVEFTADGAELARLGRRELARRDLTVGTATDGAELAPTTLFGQLYAQLREGATSMFTLGRAVVTQAGEAMDFPAASSFSSAVLVAEGAALTESDPQFTTVTLNAYKYGLAIQVSYELEQDNAVAGALSWVVDQAVDGIRRGVGAALVTADGSSKPNGVDNGSTTSTATGVTYPTTDNLINATHDIASPYRANAVWVFNDDTVKGIRTLKDTTNQYLWQPGLVAGQPDRLLGAPVFTDNGFATVGANAKIGVYGDLQRGYLVRTVSNIRAERSRDYAFLNDLATWRFLGRFDGEIIDNNAFTVITNEAS